MDERKLEKLNKLFSVIKDNTITTKEIEKFLTLLIGVVKKSKQDFDKLSSENLKTIKDSIAYIEQYHKDNLSLFKEEKNTLIKEFLSTTKELKDLISKVKTIKPVDGKDGKDGKNPDPKEVADLVLKALPETKEITGEDIANKLEMLDGEDKLDFKALKNVPKFNGGNSGGVVARNIYQMGDVVLTSLANNDTLKWNSTNNRWENGVGGGAGTIDGSGTANELSYWVDADTLGTLAVATYPSLTEVSYLKGVTSAIQTQLNSKQASGSYLTASNIVETITNGVTTNAPSENAVFDALALKEPAKGADDNYVTDAQLVVISNTSGTNTGDQDLSTLAPKTSPTFATSITGSYLTASEMLITDGSKNIVSAPVATYPSLTELTYLKGVTSAIQTQLNAKGIGDVTKVGTPVNNQIGVWTGSGTIEGDTNFTWDGSTNTILGNSLLSKTGTATVGTQTYDSNEYKLQGSQWFTSGSVAKTLTGGMTIKPRNPGAIVTSTLDFGYAIDSSTERPVISYKVGDHYNDGFAGQLTLRSGYWDGIGSFATGYGSAFGGMIETQYDGTFAFRPVGGSGTTFSGMRALSFGTHPTYASFWSRWGYGGGSDYSADIRTSFNGQVNIGAGLPDWISAGTGASGAELLNVTIDQVITGNNASRPALRITKATEQLRLGYDASNYFQATVASTGSTTFNLVGTSPVFTFSDDVQITTAGTNSASAVTVGGTQTLTNKTIALGSNTVSGTLAQLNTAVTDAEIARTDAGQTFTGVQTFSSDPIIPDEAYGSGWNGVLEPPTKNAVYDKIESLAIPTVPFYQQKLATTLSTVDPNGTDFPFAMGSNTDGSVMWVYESASVMKRYARDTNTGAYYVTHSINPTRNLTKSGSIILIGTKIYIFSSDGTNVISTSWDAADLTNEANMTVPTVTSANGPTAWTNGTNAYVVASGAGTTVKTWTVSGTTFSASASTACQDVFVGGAGKAMSTMWDGTTVYILKGTNLSTNFSVYKLADVLASSFTTTTYITGNGTNFYSNLTGGPYLIPIDSTKIYLGCLDVVFNATAQYTEHAIITPFTKP